MSAEEDRERQRRETLLTFVEQGKDMMAAFNGVKRQLVDEGWDSASAEHMVVETVRCANIQAETQLENLRTFNLQLKLKLAELGIR